MKNPFSKFMAVMLACVMLLGVVPAAAAEAVFDGFEALVTGDTSGTYTDTTAKDGTYQYYVYDQTTGKYTLVTATAGTALADPGDAAVYNSGTVTTVTTPGSTTYTLDTDGVDSGAKYLIVASSKAYAAYASGNSFGAQSVTISGSTATISANEAAALWVISLDGSYYTVRNNSTSGYLALSVNDSSATAELQTQSADVSILAGTTEGQYYIRSTSSSSGSYGYFYYKNKRVAFTAVRTNTKTYIRLYKQQITASATTYTVDRAGLDSLLIFVGKQTITENLYTAASYKAYTDALAAANAVTVTNPYTTETAAATAQSSVNTAATNLYNAYVGLAVDPNAPLVAFSVTTDPEYDDGSVTVVKNDDGTYTATATPDDGFRFCYWTAVINGNAFYSEEATITAANTAAAYYAWFIKANTDGSIITPITWKRTDEELGKNYASTSSDGTASFTTVSGGDSDSDGSYVIGNIPTYQAGTDTTETDYQYKYYGVKWNMIKSLTVSDSVVWDYLTDSQYGTDGNYGLSKYSGSVIAATWNDLEDPSNWEDASARMFRGTFLWPAGYTTSDIIKMISVNDANYTAVYDYINTYIANNPTDTAFIEAFQNGSVVPINDDMFVFIHKASDDLTALDSTDAMNYNIFSTGSTGKGIWSNKSISANDWGKTNQTIFISKASYRAFYRSYPNLATASSGVTSLTDSTPFRHTDGWYTVLKTNAVASTLGNVYGVDTEIAGGTEFYLDIYCIDNSTSGGMDRWDLSFKKTERSVTVNYYLDSVTTTTSDNYLGSATINDKVVDDEIALVAGNSAAQLDYLKALAEEKTGSEYYVQSGVQQGVIPYIVTTGTNVINVVYIRVAKSGIQFASVGATYNYDGTVKTANTINFYYLGVPQTGGVMTTNSNGTYTWTWTTTVTESGRSVTYIAKITVAGTSGTYVGSYENPLAYADAKYTNFTMTRNGSDYLGYVTQNAPHIGYLVINPVSYTFTYDYAKNNSYELSDSAVKGNYSYTPASMVFTAPYLEALDRNSDGVAEYSITVVPATTVIYEEDFLDYTDAEAKLPEGSAEGATIPAVDYNRGQWLNIGSGETVTITDNSSSVYGYTSSYNAYLTYSGGTAKKVTVDEYAKNATATFTFTGTAFDIISLTDNDASVIVVKVYNEEGKLVKTDVCDLYYGYTYDKDTDTWSENKDSTDTIYQVPAFKVDLNDYGTYTAVITVGYARNLDHDATNNSWGGGDTIFRSTFYLDAIRVYNTAKGNTVAENKYTADDEQSPSYLTLRDVLVDGGTITADTEGTAGGTVFIDGKDNESDVAQYANCGPNNEVYLAYGQGISFKLSASDVTTIKKILLGCKLAYGSTANNAKSAVLRVFINGTELAGGINLKTSSDMFYEIADASKLVDGQITILLFNSTENSIISLTDLKVTGGAVLTAVMSRTRSVSYAYVSSSYAMARAAYTSVSTYLTVLETFVPDEIEADASVIFKKATVSITTSEDVQTLTLNGKELTYVTTKLYTGFGRNRTSRTVRIWTYTEKISGTTDYEVVAYDEAGHASEPLTVTATVRSIFSR